MVAHGPARVVIFAAGTEGDVRPYLALGRGLAAAGHTVVLATSRECGARVQAEGLEFAPMTADVRGVAQRYPGILDGRRGLRMVRILLREMHGMARSWAQEGVEAACGATLVIGSGNVALVGASVAENMGVPFVMASVQPFEPSRNLPPVILRPSARSGPVNLLLHHGVRALLWGTLRKPINSVRRDLGLQPFPWAGPWGRKYGFGAPTLYAFSPHVLPKQPEWPDWVAVPGFFSLPEDRTYTPPPHLARFLAAGPPPIYAGFGSMVSGQVAELGRIVVEAACLAGQRAVIARGWMGLGDGIANRGDICVIDDVPHEWLFARMALTVHHCGVGTVAAAVRAGIATVPVPFAGDQFFNAWQLQRLGVAVPALDRRRLTATILAASMRQAASAALRERAAALGALTRAEDGVGNAVRQLQAWGLLGLLSSREKEDVLF